MLAELLRNTVAVDPEICTCGARMIVDDAITEAEKIAEILARLGIESTGPPSRGNLRANSITFITADDVWDLPETGRFCDIDGR